MNDTDINLNPKSYSRHHIHDVAGDGDVSDVSDGICGDGIGGAGGMGGGGWWRSELGDAPSATAAYIHPI